MNRASIGGTSFEGSAIDWPFSRASASAYASRSRCTAAGSSTVNFTGLSSAIVPSLSFAIFIFLTPVRIEYQITVDDYADRETRPNRQCRLDIEIALNSFLSDLIQTVTGSAAKCLHDIAVVAGTRGGAEFRYRRPATSKAAPP